MNIVKAHCQRGSRATIIRTKPISDETTILTVCCDNPECQRLYKVSLSFYKEIAPPITPQAIPESQQLTIFDGCI